VNPLEIDNKKKRQHLSLNTIVWWGLIGMVVGSLVGTIAGQAFGH